MDSRSAYAAYIRQHKAYVQEVYNKYGYVLYTVFPQVPVSEMEYRVRVHDASKFDDEEFEPYRAYFYPKSGEQPDKAAMRKAWSHHYMNNDHHVEHWFGDEMSDAAIFEMILDWEAMSIYHKSDCLTWFENSEEKTLLHPDSRRKVYAAIGAIDKALDGTPIWETVEDDS